MWDPETQKLTFLNSLCKRRTQKAPSKTKALKSITSFKNMKEKTVSDQAPRSENLMADMLKALPAVGTITLDDGAGRTLQYLPNGAMVLKSDETTIEKPAEPPLPSSLPTPSPLENFEVEDNDFDPDQVETETEDPAEVTLTDFVETTDSEFPDWRNILKQKFVD